MIPALLHTDPLFNYIYAFAPLASVLNRVSKCYALYTKLCPPSCLPTSPNCRMLPALQHLCGSLATPEKGRQELLKQSITNAPRGWLLISRDENLILRKLLLHRRVSSPHWQQADTFNKHYSPLKRNKQVLYFLHLPPVLMNPALLFIGCNLSELL